MGQEEHVLDIVFSAACLVQLCRKLARVSRSLWVTDQERWAF